MRAASGAIGAEAAKDAAARRTRTTAATESDSVDATILSRLLPTFICFLVSIGG